MTAAIICDQCHETVSEHVRHFHVENRGATTLRQDAEQDFCSHACMARWAEAMSR